MTNNQPQHRVNRGLGTIALDQRIECFDEVHMLATKANSDKGKLSLSMPRLLNPINTQVDVLAVFQEFFSAPTPSHAGPLVELFHFSKRSHCVLA